MKKIQTVFLRSTLRQPVRSALLLFLVIVVAFACTVRFLECALVLRETGRATSYYRAVGTLEEDGLGADWQQATALLENAPHVKLVEKRWLTSGVLPEGIYNADTSGYTYGVFPDSRQSDIVFYAVLESSERRDDGCLLRVKVDGVVTGYPEYLAPGKRLEVMALAEHASGVEGMTPGGRYLMRAVYDPNNRAYCFDSGAMAKYLFVPLTARAPVVEAPRDLDLSELEDGSFAFTVQMIQENQRSMNVMALWDMSAFPGAQESVRTYFLREGRFLTAEDTEENRQVCVIRDTFAHMRGYELGDTLTLRLRNIPSMGGYLDVHVSSDEYDGFPTREVALEIVGIAGMDAEFSLYQNMVFIPASVIPDSFQPRMERSPGVYTEQIACSFELDSPEDSRAFLLETAVELQALGIKATMIENGWEAFQPVARSMRDTAQHNAVLFGVILLAASGVLSFVYFLFRRRDMAISRALGVPVVSCALSSALPPVLMGGVGALLGGGLGVWYMSARAGELLSALSGVQAQVQAAVPAIWAVLIALGVFLFVAATAVVFGILAACRPVLALLQGNGRRTKKPAPASALPAERPEETRAARTHYTSRKFSPKLPPMWRTGKPAQGFTVRYVRAHILRAPVRSLLSLLLAAGFTVAVMTIEATLTQNQAEVDRLYQSIPVDGRIIMANAGVGVSGEGFIRQETVDKLLETGFLSDGYYEAAQLSPIVYSYDAGTGTLRTSVYAEQVQMYGFTDFEAFASRRDLPPEINYREAFVQPFEMDGRLFREGNGKLVVSRELYSALDIQPDQVNIAVSVGGGIASPGVVGVTDMAGYVILGSLETIKDLSGDDTLYSVVEFTIAPDKVEKLEEFRAAASQVVGRASAGTVPLSLQLRDQQLRQAVDPLEETLGFMRALYPIAAVLSVLLSMGIAALLVVSSARETAILRVLGGSRKRARSTAVLVVLLPWLAGMALGQIGGWIMAWSMAGAAAGALVWETILYAGLCLGAAAAGAAIGAVLTTRENPLDLIQGKE